MGWLVMKVDVSKLKDIEKNSELNRIFDDLTWEIEQRAKDIAASIMIKGQAGKKFDVGDIHEIQSILEEMGVISREHKP